MGEWSDYFEDFPEENPANYVESRFDPQGAEKQREQHAKVASDQRNLNAEIQRIVKLHKQPGSGNNSLGG
jgi:hypothetical protein